MNLHEQLAMKRAELAALKSKIEAKDADAIKAGAEIAEAIKSIEAAIDEANKANDLLKMIGDDEPSATPAEDEAKNGMKGLIAQVKGVDRHVKGWSAYTHFKANTTVVTTPNIADNDKTVAPVKRASRVGDLFTTFRISGTGVNAFRRGATEGTATSVAQGAKKPQMSTSFTSEYVALSKIAVYTKETDELLKDAPFLASTVESLVNYALIAEENREFVTDIASTSGIQSVTYTSGNNTGDAANLVEAILLAKSKIAQLTNYTADCVLINPADMFTLMTAKDSNLQYLGGGYFSGAYGNGDYTTPVYVWGLPVFESSAVTVGEPLVVAGKQAVKVYRNDDITVNVYDQNEDDVIYNRVTVRGEESAKAYVHDLNGVVKISAATA